MPSRKKSIPPDDNRCLNSDSAGRRCRDVRLEGHSLCGPHYFMALRDAEKRQPFPAIVAAEILPADTTLDSAAAVNAMLTRVARCVLDGRLAPRHASALGYLGQLILATLPGMERAAEKLPGHPLLGHNPEAALTSLVEALSHSLAPATTQTKEESLRPTGT